MVVDETPELGAGVSYIRGSESFLPRPGFDPLPEDRDERVRILRRSSDEYISRMGEFEVRKIIEGIARSGGLSELEVEELLDEKYPVVAPEWIPKEFR